MEGRYPRGLLLAITSCTDSSRQDEFANWYNHMHVPDVTSTGVFRHAIRFANTDPNSSAGQYVATYETDWDNLPDALQAHREFFATLNKGEGRSSPLMQVVTSGVFKRLGGEYSSAAKPTRGILVVLSNCNDASDEDEFNRWYEDVHIPDILDAGAFHTAYRYESVDPEATKAKYLALYETDNIDPGKAREAHAKARPDWERRGRLFDGLDVVSSLTASRIWPTIS